MAEIPKSHPRYWSLKTREKISEGLKKGWVHETGLIAHGRGEAFDYLMGETTIPPAVEAEKVAAALLLNADSAVISVNGNVVALAAEECVSLSEAADAKVEVNLFHRTSERVENLADALRDAGADRVYGLEGDASIPGLEHDRGLCDKDGIFSADVVFVPLEDGDRCQALKKMGKTVVAVDLNPVSRTAKTADVTIVDNVVRALPNIQENVEKFKDKKDKQLEELFEGWDNHRNLQSVLDVISKRLNSMF
ncbi:MAG: 4-phosphopantoate--beta-alanine ligase [Candidatus Thermoplasmatota archaeon]